MKKNIPVKIKRESNKDTVVFMTAYKTPKMKKMPFSFIRKPSLINDLLKCHISNIMIKDTVLTHNGGLTCKTDFDYFNQSATYNFKVISKDQKIDDFKHDLDALGWCIALKNSFALLFDSNYFNLNLFINPERFLVYFNERCFQVDSILYVLNDVVFINFELINSANEKPLTSDEIYGKVNNYNILPVTGYRYYGDDEITKDIRTIPEIIFENFTLFVKTALKRSYNSEFYSYVHNLLVCSNSTSDINRYFTDVLDPDNILIESEIKNLNSNNAYRYYSQDFLGLVTAYTSENEVQATYDPLMLESLKLLVYLNQIIIYDVKNNLSDIFENNAYLNLLIHSPNTPIITRNVIGNILDTESYKQRANAIEFKLSYLNAQNERRRYTNSLLLNVLIYLLTFIGSIGTLQVFSDEFGWPFNTSVIILSILFFVWDQYGYSWSLRKGDCTSIVN